MNLKQLIQETVQRELRRLLEDIEQGFSFDELMQCSDIDQAKEYLDSHLEKAGEGSHRITYGLDETRVIKLVKNNVLQNAQEARNSRCMSRKYVVQVFEKHPEFWWIVVERVQKLSLSEFIAEFERRVKTTIPAAYKQGDQALEEKQSRIMMAIEWGADATNPHQFDEHNEWMKTSAWYRGLIASLRNCQVQADDFHSNNWGLRPGTNELVLLDLGFAE